MIKVREVAPATLEEPVVNGLFSYLWRSRWAVVATSPFLYACALGFFVLDLLIG